MSNFIPLVLITVTTVLMTTAVVSHISDRLDVELQQLNDGLIRVIE